MRVLVVTAVLISTSSLSAEPTWVDARISTYAQYFQQGLVPGQPGAVTRVEPAFPFTAVGFVRFGAIDLPGAADALGGELALWGSLGPRDGRAADADVTSAFAQLRRGPLRLKLGRQVTLPGSSRYVRFDGLSAGVTFGVFDLDAYAGWVALPRWNQPRGASLLGFVGDGLNDPLLLEAQNRVGQFTAGVRTGLTFSSRVRASLAFHEQRDAVGVAFRVLSTDALVRPLPWLAVGGRLSFDARALAVSEARAYVDITRLAQVPVSLDYSYQAPALLLPQTSVLAAFGGAAWHELGVETTVRLLSTLRITARGAGQLFEGDQLGGRGQLRVQWTPGLDARTLVLAEVNRLLVPPSGYTQLRVGARWRATQTITTSADAALFLYDVPVRDAKYSATAVGSLEWAARPWLRALLSGTVMQTPYASFEAQLLGRLVVELDPVSGGAGL